jgi:hypothetical protein
MSNRGPGRASATRSERRRAAAARRRQLARRETASVHRQSQRHRRRRLALFIGAPVLLVAVVGTVVVLTRDDSEALLDELTAPIVAEEGDVLPVDDLLESYRVQYRIETPGADGVVQRTEDILIRRPFDAHITVYPGAEATGTPEVEALSSLGFYADITTETPDAGTGLPAAALGDLRVDGVLDDLVEAGLFQPRERREVLGRECQVYRTGQAVETMQLAAPTDSDFADVCIDASGLVLEEVAITGGESQLHEIATLVDTAPEVDDDAFTVDAEPLALADGGNELDEVDRDVVPAGGYWVPSATPEGYEHVGRYVLRSLAPEDEAASGDTATTTTAGVAAPETVETFVDVYQDGARFVIVHQGAASESPGRDTTVGTDVDAGALGPARVAYGLTGNALVVTTDTWFVEITAPMPAADLATLAATFIAAP